jgi:hypothetical protein
MGIVQVKLKKMCAGHKTLVSSAGASWWFSATGIVEAISSVLEATSACACVGINVHVIDRLGKTSGRRSGLRYVGGRWNILHIDVEESTISLLI